MIYILVFLSATYDGGINFQEFNSLNQCEANVKYLKEIAPRNTIYCTKKG